MAETIEIKHLIEIIEMLDQQIEEIDKKIEEFAHENDSPILSIPGISYFSGTSILAELGDLHNYSKSFSGHKICRSVSKQIQKQSVRSSAYRYHQERIKVSS